MSPSTNDPTMGRMPVVFAGHGSPMNVIEDNRWSRGFAGLRELVARPAAILAVSAHWFVDGTYLTGDASPETLHDFSGFPRPLYEIE
jgi:4,5-DOPA dioxygenase extradiol